MGRSPCYEKNGLKKGPWTREEDEKLRAYIEQHGIGFWSTLPAKAGLQRCRNACQLRWTKFLRPDIKRGKFSLVEEQTIIQLHPQLGNRWSAIATHLPKRTDHEIKNYWNTHLKKRQANKMAIDPATRTDDAPGTGGRGRTGGGSAAAAGALQHAKHPAAHLSSHTAQWESARLGAAARQLRLRAVSAPPPQMPTRLDSPTTSTLSSSGSAAFASVLQETHYGAAVPAPAPAARAGMQLQMQPIMPAYKEAPRKDDRLQQQRWGDHVVDVADVDIAAAASAGMLLDESLHQQQTEEEKKYWVFIMNLV